MEDNDGYIRKSAADCEMIILAWGTGALTNKRITNRIDDVTSMLGEYTDKMFVISDGNRKGLHPLTPTIRSKWLLEKYTAPVSSQEHTNNLEEAEKSL